MAEVLTTATQSVRAAALVLAQAERIGLPDPVWVSSSREYDTDVSRGRAHVGLLFSTFDALRAWADHLQAGIVERPGTYTYARHTWHYEVAGEWLDVQLVLTAVTEDRALLEEVSGVR